MLMPMIMQNAASSNAYAHGGGVVAVAALMLTAAHVVVDAYADVVDAANDVVRNTKS